MTGRFRLREPPDLLAKLEHDYRRLEYGPSDVYAAFDFFVTAEHMLDWVYPGNVNRNARSQERNSEVVLQVVSHLANGAKHMILEDPRHVSIEHADVIAEPYGVGSYGAGAYGGLSLVIALDGEAADVLGETVSPLDLAHLVLEYWRNHPAIGKPSD